MVPFFVFIFVRRRFTRMRDALMRLLEPPIEALDYELVDIEYAREGRGGVVRVFIDRRVEELGGRSGIGLGATQNAVDDLGNQAGERRRLAQVDQAGNCDPHETRAASTSHRDRGSIDASRVHHSWIHSAS